MSCNEHQARRIWHVAGRDVAGRRGSTPRNGRRPGWPPSRECASAGVPAESRGLHLEGLYQVVAAAVDGGRRTEDQPLAAVAQQVRGELQALFHVRPVVPHRIGHRVGDHDQGRAMDHRVDVRVLRENTIDQRAVRDFALIEFPARRELAPARDQAVQDHRADP
jgi:hypothetical protein